jgi:hypothetical protein
MMDALPNIAEETLYPPKLVAQYEGCCLAEVYNRLTRGEYQAFKDRRKTLIPGASILKRRRKFLKPAVYAAPKSKPNNRGAVP